MTTRRQAAIAGFVLVLSLVPAIGRAAPEGCVAIGTQTSEVAGQRPWDCFYTATGPSYYTANTSNPFVIAVSKDNGVTWSEIVQQSRPGSPRAGSIATAAGDLVSVSISCWDYASGRPCGSQHGGGGRFGTIVAHSKF